MNNEQSFVNPPFGQFLVTVIGGFHPIFLLELAVKSTVRHLGFFGDCLQAPLRMLTHQAGGMVEPALLYVLRETTPGKLFEQDGEFVGGYVELFQQVLFCKTRV